MLVMVLTECFKLLALDCMMAGKFSQNMSSVLALFMAWNEAMYVHQEKMTLILHTFPSIDYFCPRLPLICPLSILWLRVLSTRHWSQRHTTGEGRVE